nr:YggT family protein [Nesterenkonia lacusekhoensis]
MLLVVFQLALVIRIIFDITQQYARFWRPKGAALLLAMAVYAVTDPPIRWLQKRIPPLQLGGVALDMGFLITFFAVVIAQMVLRSFA